MWNLGDLSNLLINFCEFQQNQKIFLKLLTLAAQEIVKMTSSGAASDENFIILSIPVIVSSKKAQSLFIHSCKFHESISKYCLFLWTNTNAPWKSKLSVDETVSSNLNLNHTTSRVECYIQFNEGCNLFMRETLIWFQEVWIKLNHWHYRGIEVIAGRLGLGSCRLEQA